MKQKICNAMADVVFDPVTTNLTGLLMIPLLIIYKPSRTKMAQL